MADNGALASKILAKSFLSWAIPDEWSLQDAVTVPVAYGTMIYGLKMVRQITK